MSSCIASESRSELGRLLAEVTPGDLSVSFFTNGGAEANENAVKLARLATGRHKIIARYRSYHGATYMPMALSGDARTAHQVDAEAWGVRHVPPPYAYRCPFGSTSDEECGRRAARAAPGGCRGPSVWPR